MKKSILITLPLVLIFPLLVAQDINKKPIAKRELLKQFNLATQLYYGGKVEQAMDIHEKLISSNNYEESYLELAAMYKEVGQVFDALNYYARLYELYPRNEEYKKYYFITAVQAHRFSIAKQLLPIDNSDSENLFYLGLMNYDEGYDDRALLFFTEAQKINPYMAEAAYFRGKIYAKKKNYKEAINEFSGCLKIEPNFTMVLYDLAIAYELSGDYKRALSVLYRARSNLGESNMIKDAISRILKSHPTDTKKDEEQRADRKEKMIPPNVQYLSSVAVNDRIMVRIGIIEKVQEISIKTGGDYDLSNGVDYYQGKAGDLLSIKHQKNGLIIVLDRNDHLIFRSSTDINLSYNNPRITTAVFDIVNGAGYFFAGTVDRIYRGDFAFLSRNHSLTLVNILEMEEYLYSVVPSEIPAYWPAEALKAQAVAARSFTMAQLGTYNSRGFDLYGSIVSHAYTGVKGEDSRTTKAVRDTQGQLIYEDTKNKKVMITYYSANNGAYTEKGSVIWNNHRGHEHEAVPDKKIAGRNSYIPLQQMNLWIKERPLTYSSWPKFHTPAAFRSSMWVNAYEMQLRVSRQQKVGEITAIIPRQRGISGRIAVADAIGTNGIATISGDQIRGRLGGLRTNLVKFDLKLDKDGRVEYFIIHSAGWGHGVGMDQSGAAGMAADGFSYSEILKFYYPNGTLLKYKK